MTTDCLSFCSDCESGYVSEIDQKMKISKLRWRIDELALSISKYIYTRNELKRYFTAHETSGEDIKLHSNRVGKM